MKLSKKEVEMMGAVKSKMRYAGETYHRVAPAEVEISKIILGFNNIVDMLKGKRKRPEQKDERSDDDADNYNTLE